VRELALALPHTEPVAERPKEIVLAARCRISGGVGLAICMPHDEPVSDPAELWKQQHLLVHDLEVRTVCTACAQYQLR
jgi:hypothetical protein